MSHENSNHKRQKPTLIKSMLNKIFILSANRAEFLRDVTIYFVPTFNFLKNENVVYYQLFFSTLILSFISNLSLVFIFYDMNKSLIWGQSAIKFMNDYSFKVACIIVLIFMPFFLIRMICNTNEDYNFISKNPNWKTKELQEKNRIHMLIIGIVGCMVYLFLFFCGQFSFLLHRNSDLIGKVEIYSYAIFTTFIFPYAAVAFLKSILLIKSSLSRYSKPHQQ